MYIYIYIYKIGARALSALGSVFTIAMNRMVRNLKIQHISTRNSRKVARNFRFISFFASLRFRYTAGATLWMSGNNDLLYHP